MDTKEYTVAELARLLNVNEETVRRWRIRGRNGVRLEVPHADEFPGRKGYTVPAASIERFLVHNTGLMTEAMRASLAGEDAPAASGSGRDTSAASGAFLKAATVDMLGDLRPSEASGGIDQDRAALVMHGLLEEKRAQRERLLAQLSQVEEEIQVLRQYGGEPQG